MLRWCTEDASDTDFLASGSQAGSTLIRDMRKKVYGRPEAAAVAESNDAFSIPIHLVRIIRNKCLLRTFLFSVV